MGEARGGSRPDKRPEMGYTGWVLVPGMMYEYLVLVQYSGSLFVH